MHQLRWCCLKARLIPYNRVVEWGMGARVPRSRNQLLGFQFPQNRCEERRIKNAWRIGEER